MANRRTPRLSELIRQPPRSPEAPPDRPPADSAPPAEASAPPAAAAPEPAPPAPATPRIEPSPAETEARTDYGLLERWAADLLESARRGSLEADDVLDNVRAVLERPSLLDALFAETFKTRRQGDPLARKSLNVSIYALRLGRALAYEDEALVELGAAGLLAKIGLARIPVEVVAKPGALDRREISLVREHPRIARDLIAGLGERFARIAEFVYQASERIDGSGYPLGLRNAAIRTEALVLGLVDVFEALIQPRPYRERMVPFRAVKEILERERERFPRSLLREFIASFSVFPPFTYVRLNSKAVARVEETEAGYPLRPRVTIVLDANGQPPSKPQTLRLRESPLLYITGPVSEEELPV